jgi:hypothetical protein
MTPDLAHRRLMRSLAVILTILWVAIAVAVASAYRPGGPIDLVVALACFVPVIVADAGIIWPPLARSRRGRIAVVWIWIAAVLFAIPVLYNIAVSLAEDGPRSLVPSLEAAYAGAIALFAMAFFSVTGWVHLRERARVFSSRASWLAAALAALATLAGGAAFVFVAYVNDQALRDDGAIVSRFGPTDPELVPPFCDEPLRLGPNAAIEITAASMIDGEQRGRARLVGHRGGIDETWGGSWSRPEGDGQQAYLRVGSQAWLNDTSDDPTAAGTTWRQVQPDPFGLGGRASLTTDGPPQAVVDVPRGEIIPEDLGLVVVEGARARHCRTFMDGATALDTFLPLRWVLYGSSELSAIGIDRWRGEMDWWVFGDGELGLATAEVSGSRAEAPWDASGVRAVLSARLEATERDRGFDVAAPVLGGAAASAATPSPARSQAPPTLAPVGGPDASATPTLGSNDT